MDVKKAITVNRLPDELYQFWHNFENLPRFMEHLEAVRVTGAGRSHWTASRCSGASTAPSLAAEWHSGSTRGR